MSASTAQKPYSNGAQGRMPLPPWVKTTGVGLSVVATAAIASWLLIVPHRHVVKSAPGVDWSPGAEIHLPADAPADVKPDPTTRTNDDLPGPAATPAAPTIRRMQVWGGDSGNVSVPGVQQARYGGQNGPPPRAGWGSGGSASAAGADGQNAPPTSEYGAMLTPTRTHMTEAGVYEDPSLLLPEGKDFGCLLKSPLDNQLPGGIVCIATEDVWSSDGANILINKWATVRGQITRGMELGQDRAFILWTSVRSKSVHAELDSPATDALGQIGVPGYLDQHLWQKIKAAALLTGLETAGNTAQSLASRGNGNTNLSFSQGQSLASQALQHDMNIRTTIFVGQATEMRVYIQHDIQFHRAYNNVLVAGVS